MTAAIDIGKTRWTQFDIDALRMYWPDFRTISIQTGRSEEAVKAKGYSMGYRTVYFDTRSIVERACLTQRRRAMNWAFDNRIKGRIVKEIL